MPNSSSTEDLLAELRFTNRLLLLALGDRIADRIRTLVSSPSVAVVIRALEEGEAATEDVQRRAAAGGVSRSTFFRVVGDLERIGVVERRQRGWLAINPVVAALLPSALATRSQLEEPR